MGVRERVSVGLQGRGRRSVSMTFCYPASDILLKDITDKRLQMRQTAEQPVMSPLLSVRPHKIFEGQDKSLRPWLIVSRQRLSFSTSQYYKLPLPISFHMAFLCQETRRGGKRKKKKETSKENILSDHIKLDDASQEAWSAKKTKHLNYCKW